MTTIADSQDKDVIELDPNFSTTRLVTREKPAIANNSSSEVQALLFLPPTSERKGEGGLRTKGYFKHSYNESNDLSSQPLLPLVTIITVVFNGEKCLEQTIQSVINQTYDNIEYIVIDGGSTDGTVDIIRKYEDKIDYWVSEPDKGIYDAMNKGWQLSTKGSYILFLGAGDEIINLPTIPKAAEPKDVFFGNVLMTDNQVYDAQRAFRISRFKLGNSVHHQGLLVNKSFWEDLPFDLRYRIYSDYNFNVRLLKKGANFIFKDDLVARAAPGGISSKLDIVEMLGVVKKYYGIFWLLAAIIYRLYQGFKYGFNGIKIDFK